MKTNYNYISINEEEFKKQKVKTNYCFIAVILFISIVLLWINYFYSDIDDIDFSEGVGFIVPAPTEIVEATITAFNTVESQCDSSPCISASGDNICGRDDVVACPTRYAFGTKVKIDDKIYTCLDRTAKKFGDRFDISYDKDIAGARLWGVKTKQVIIYK